MAAMLAAMSTFGSPSTYGTAKPPPRLKVPATKPSSSRTSQAKASRRSTWSQKELASKIVARGGVIGLNLCPPFVTDDGKPKAEDILRHIDFALENYGEGSLGFGFDIDGTDGMYPEGITEQYSIHDQVLELLSKHYSNSVIEAMAGGNVINFLKNNLS